MQLAPAQQREETLLGHRPREEEALAHVAAHAMHGLQVRGVLDAFRDRYDVSVESVVTTEERIAFNVPRELREAGAL